MSQVLVGRDLLEKLVLAGLHDLSLVVCDMVIAQKMEHAMHEEEPRLIGCSRAELFCLAFDIGGGKHDVAELAGLPVSQIGVVWTLAFEREHVGRTVLAAPLEGPSGMESARQILSGIPGIAFCDLGRADVVRHSLVARIIEAYDKAARKDGPHGA